MSDAAKADASANGQKVADASNGAAEAVKVRRSGILLRYHGVGLACPNCTLNRPGRRSTALLQRSAGRLVHVWPTFPSAAALLLSHLPITQGQATQEVANKRISL